MSDLLAMAALSQIQRMPRNVLDVTKQPWGADPTGLRESGDKINAAIEWAAENGLSSVFIPAGVFILETPIIIRSHVTIFGVGWETVLKVKTGANINAVESAGEAIRATMYNLTIDGSSIENTSIYTWDRGFGINGAFGFFRLEFVNFQNINKTAIRLNYEDRFYENVDVPGGYLNRIFYNNIQDAGIYGIEIGYRATDSMFGFNNVGSSVSNLCIGGGVHRFMYNHLDGNPDHNVFVPYGAQNLMFVGNIMENTTKQNILIQNPGYEWAAGLNFKISDNFITNSSNAGDGLYDMIKIEGYEGSLTKNVSVTNNNFYDATGVKSRYCIAANDIEGLLIASNTFVTAYSADSPVAIANCPYSQISLNSPSAVANVTRELLAPYRE